MHPQLILIGSPATVLEKQLLLAAGTQEQVRGLVLYLQSMHYFLTAATIMHDIFGTEAAGYDLPAQERVVPPQHKTLLGVVY
jgi:hypothetical protein